MQFGRKGEGATCGNTKLRLCGVGNEKRKEKKQKREK